MGKMKNMGLGYVMEKYTGHLEQAMDEVMGEQGSCWYMKGSEAKLLVYMEGAKKRFIIPVYQRNYDWKTENCKQL